MDHAHLVFDSVIHPDIVLCNALILGYVRNGDGGAALDVFSTAVCLVSPTAKTLAAALQACSALAASQLDCGKRDTDTATVDRALRTGSRIHSWIITSSTVQLESDIVLCAALIDMYAKCGAVESARRVFDAMQACRRDVVCWTALLLGYADSGQATVTMELLEAMLRDACCKPNARTMVAAIKACSSLVDGDSNHGHQHSHNHEVAKVAALERGMALHSLATALGFESDKFVACTLIHMYARCGSVALAQQVFHRLDVDLDVDAAAITGMMLAYANNGRGDAALELLSANIHKVDPDPPTFVAAIKACIDLAGREEDVGLGHAVVKPVSLEKGMFVHSVATRLDKVTSTKAVASTLVTMYARCGSMMDARRVFDEARARGKDSIVLWNALIFGYTDLGHGREALDVLLALPCVPSNDRTLVAALKAIATAAAAAGDDDPELKVVCLERGMAIHRQALQQNGGSVDDLFVGNALVDMFAKSGSLIDARRAFWSMRQHDAVSWNIVISASADTGDVDSALAALSQMECEGNASRPDVRTFIALLRACGTCAQYQAGRAVHAKICRNGKEGDEAVTSCMVEFYGRCGSMEHARRLFDAAVTGRAQIQAWNALLAGYSRQGECKSGMELFYEMQEAGCEPNGVTYLAILTLCNHAGAIDLALEVLACMRDKLGSGVLRLQHHNCIADVFARAGQSDLSGAN